MIACIVRIMFRRRPGVPLLARWTLIAPTVSFYMRPVLVHNIFCQLLGGLFQPMEIKRMQEAVDSELAASGAMDNQAAVVQSEIHFHAAAGKRLHSAKEFWGAPRTPLRLYHFSRVLLPLFFVTHWLLKYGKDVPDLSLIHI